ncbi:OsmC family protein [Alcaligenaceae bacterium]|nr:OsmC family protein [Alcaligenaceae bacterium]
MANIVETRSTGVPGIWLSQARTQTLLSGATPANGGSGNTWLAGELLLASLNTCATSLLHAAAAEKGLALSSLRIAAESERDPDRPDHYARVHLGFTLGGVEEAQARELVEYFKRECPIYGTVSRGAPVSVAVMVAD